MTRMNGLRHPAADGSRHHNASAQVFAEGRRRTRFVWVADLLPDEMTAAIASMMEQGLAAIRRTLEPTREAVNVTSSCDTR